MRFRVKFDVLQYHITSSSLSIITTAFYISFHRDYFTEFFTECACEWAHPSESLN